MRVHFFCKVLNPRLILLCSIMCYSISAMADFWGGVYKQGDIITLYSSSGKKKYDWYISHGREYVRIWGGGYDDDDYMQIAADYVTPLGDDVVVKCRTLDYDGYHETEEFEFIILPNEPVTISYTEIHPTSMYPSYYEENVPIDASIELYFDCLVERNPYTSYAPLLLTGENADKVVILKWKFFYDFAAQTSILRLTPVDDYYMLPENLPANSLCAVGIPIGFLKIAYTWNVSSNSLLSFFTTGSTTDMSPSITDDNLPDVYYDLNGRRVDKPGKGIYIKKKKKVVIP